jgi:hypothetical protein
MSTWDRWNFNSTVSVGGTLAVNRDAERRGNRTNDYVALVTVLMSGVRGGNLTSRYPRLLEVKMDHL